MVIGGDGSFAGAYELNRMGFPTVGIPGTIDNDLAYTDYTLGFDTAVNTACECVNRIRETSESHERASLITVMGRDCGEIALHTAVDCGAEFALLPEVEWSVEEIADRTQTIERGVEELINARKVANKIESEHDKAIAYHDTVAPKMEEIRYQIDKLELIVEDDLWTLPKYRELLFIR